MRKTRAFTLIELLVVIAIIALLIGILLPALGAARKTARMVQNGTQVRGIHQGFMIYASGNNQWFSGLNRTGGGDGNNANWLIGDPQVASQSNYGDPSFRLRRLAELNFFAGDYMIAPIEEKKVWSAGPMHWQNFSYSLLAIQSLLLQRRGEWRATNNAEAPVISDRLISASPFTSIWVKPRRGVAISEWRGNVCWNDNHVSVEDDFTLTTTYGSSRQARRHDADNLFIEECALGRRSDAWMVHSEDNSAY